MKSKTKKLLLVLFAAVLFILANPNFLITRGLGFLAWIYYIPVFILVKKSNLKEIWLYGFLYGFLSFAGYSYWLLVSYKAAYFLVIFGYGIILSFVFFLLKITEKLFPKNHFIPQALILCSYEFIKTLGFLGLNYGVTAYTQYNFEAILQLCDVTGPFGLNLLIIFLSAILFSFGEKYYLKKGLIYKSETKIQSGISEYENSERKLKSTSMTASFICLGIWIFVFIFSLVYGIIKLNIKTNNPTVKVCAVQNNEDPWKNGINVYSENVRKLINLTNEALELNPDIKIVVWPETAVVPAIVNNYENKKDLNRNKLVLNLLEYINNQNCIFVIGNGHELVDRGGKKFYNSSLVFTPQKNVLPPKPEVYSKNHLVPFSESFPLKNKFPEIYTALIKHGSQMWEQGKEYNIFTLEDFNFSTPICFEDTFTKTGREMYKNGARAYLNLTNDSWSQSKVCQRQHLAMAIFRSIENRVPTVRSTTSGITCVINSKGKVIKQTEEFRESCLISEVEVINKNRASTLYTRFGDLCGWATVILTLGLLLIKIFIVIIKSNRK